MERFVFQSEHDFLEKLRQLVASGIDTRNIDFRAPYPVHHAEEILKLKPSSVRKFVLVGALLGAFTGYAFTAFTSLDWPMIIAGKPLVSIPPYTIIAFELMVLFGALSGFLGLLVTTRMPAVRTIVSGDEFSDDFEIHVRRDD
ncbi:MAG: DUF3341 domain-containing protein [Candidatus Krumholzibacteriota bacterium]|nr:DUF3341 domain-containing protein [Candidatus Krumholzibacteriota bacterium]